MIRKLVIDKEQATDTNYHKARRSQEKAKLTKPPKKEHTLYIPEMRMTIQTNKDPEEARNEHLRRFRGNISTYGRINP